MPIGQVSIPGTILKLALPVSVDGKRIGIDPEAVTKLTSLGGIRYLTISNLKIRKTSTLPHPLYETQTHLRQTIDDSHAWRQVDGTIEINAYAILERIARENQWPHTDSPKPWTYYLNRVIRGGITEIGMRHLCLGMSKWDYVMTGLKGAPSLILARQFAFQSGLSWENLFAAYVSYQILNYLVDHSRSLSPRSPEENHYRWSVVPRPQLDRAAILWVLAKTRTLVKALPPPDLSKEIDYGA